LCSEQTISSGRPPRQQGLGSTRFPDNRVDPPARGFRQDATSGSRISSGRDVSTVSPPQASQRYVSLSSPRENRTALRSLRAMGLLHFGHSASFIRSGIVRSTPVFLSRHNVARSPRVPCFVTPVRARCGLAPRDEARRAGVARTGAFPSCVTRSTWCDNCPAAAGLFHSLRDHGRQNALAAGFASTWSRTGTFASPIARARNSIAVTVLCATANTSLNFGSGMLSGVPT
jgi:hypothetical protein